MNTWHVNVVPSVSLFFFWLVKTEIVDQCMTIHYNFWKKCNISIIMLPFEFEFMCTLFRTVVTAQYFPTNRIRIHILSFYWYVWNSVFDLIWFLRDIFKFFLQLNIKQVTWIFKKILKFLASSKLTINIILSTTFKFANLTDTKYLVKI